MEENKKFVYGQYFTKKEVVEKLLKLIEKFKDYPKNISILEPSFGTGNFIDRLKYFEFMNIEGCELDEELTDNPMDFFEYDIDKKYDLIVGNPPFTKYNLPSSYYHKEKYLNSKIHPNKYIKSNTIGTKKEKIENIFILKSLEHLKDENSTIGFVLPISFFIGNKNKEIKNEIKKKFSTIIIFQDTKKWFDYDIPCCFAIFSNISGLNGKIINIYENEEIHQTVLDIDKLHEELIPEVIFNKKNNLNNEEGVELKEYFQEGRIKYNKSFKDNNISAKNILEKYKIPQNKNIDDYYLAVVRVGNSSVGKSGLINIKEDVLNDMFYLFKFKDKFNSKDIKEKVCKIINENQDYFKNVTCRVGSKSIKRRDVHEFKISL
jgi:hypothetical protein|tara:strand:+ start:621 stop:1748 length:1128 start_codon:yes stop_codon:yes gene_type:complete